MYLNKYFCPARGRAQKSVQTRALNEKKKQFRQLPPTQPHTRERVVFFFFFFLFLPLCAQAFHSRFPLSWPARSHPSSSPCVWECFWPSMVRAAVRSRRLFLWVVVVESLHVPCLFFHTNHTMFAQWFCELFFFHFPSVT